MTESNRTSPRFCKVLSVCLLVAAVAVFVVGVLGSPPILESFVLADGQLGGGKAKVVFYLLFVVCTLGAVAIVIVARRLWRGASRINARRIQLSLVAAGFSCLFALGLAEVAARVLLSPEQIYSGDAFWLHRWVSAHGTGPSSGGMIPDAPVDDHDPELGWAPAASFRSETVNTNSQGLRGLREHPFDKPQGEKRIVVIGDSFTFGFGVSDEHVYAELLDQRLEARVINLAGNGYGTDQQYLRLKRQGFDYDPDLVIVGHFAPDADRNVLSFRDYAKPMFRVAGDDLELQNVPIPAPDDPATKFEAPQPGLFLWSVARTTWRRMLDQTRFAPKWEVTRRILDATLELTRKNGARLLFVHMPTKRKAFSSEPEGSEIIFEAWAKERGVPYLNLRKRFRQLPREERGKMYHGHWTPFGNAIVAAAIAERITEGKMLD